MREVYGFAFGVVSILIYIMISKMKFEDGRTPEPVRSCYVTKIKTPGNCSDKNPYCVVEYEDATFGEQFKPQVGKSVVVCK